MSTPASVTVSGYRFVIYALLIAASLMLGIQFVGPATLLPLIIDETGISHSAAGFYVSVMTLMVTILGFPASIVGARMGVRRSFGIAWYLLGAAVVLPLLPGLEWIVASRLLQGVGAAALIPLQAAVLMAWAPSREVPILFALTEMAFTVGSGLALLLGPTFAAAIGWQGTLALEGGMALAGAVCWSLLARDGAARRPTPRAAPSLDLVRVTLRSSTTWLLAFAVAGPWALYNALTSWLPTFLTETRDFSEGGAAFAVSLIAFAGLPATFVGGLVAVRTGRRRPLLFVSGLGTGLTAAVALLAPSGLLLYATIAVTGFFLLVYLPGFFSIPLELSGASPERAATVSSVFTSVGNGTGFLSPVVIGVLRDAAGSFMPGFTIFVLGAATLFVAALLIPETGPRGRPAATGGA
ncbi:MAG: MFS transporter [SAR202 cluster bacterium]|nr:MFS transporter [SAR202 cluster bacterium]